MSELVVGKTLLLILLLYSNSSSSSILTILSTVEESLPVGDWSI